jgi:hypothetical protein
MTCAINVLSFPPAAVMGVTKRREMLRRIRRMDELRRVLFFTCLPALEAKTKIAAKGLQIILPRHRKQKWACAAAATPTAATNKSSEPPPNGINTSRRLAT